MRALCLASLVLTAACGGTDGTCKCSTGFVCQDDTCVADTSGATPETTLVEKPADPTNQKRAQLAFTASLVGSTFVCSLDDAVLAACTSPVVFDDPGEKTHTFFVAAQLGSRRDPTPAMHTWTVDLTPPETTITEGPSGQTSSSEAVFGFTASEAGASFLCQLDASPFMACVSGQTLFAVALGAHTLNVKAVDRAGNEDGSPATRQWTVGTAPPNTFLDTQPTSPTRSTDATFAFHADKMGSFQCRLDGAAFTTCVTPLGFTMLPEGPHTFEVRAVDASGNADQTPEKYTWIIDLTGPPVQITGEPAEGEITGRNVRFTYVSTESPVSFECALDGAAFTSCLAAGIAYTLLDGGAHVFRVRGSDALGNIGPPAALNFTVDLSGGPATVILAPSEGEVTAPDGTISYMSDAGASFECALDGAAFAACDPAGLPFDDLADGAHTVSVHATNSRGLQGPDAVRTWIVDALGPVITITSPAEGQTTGPDGTVSFTTPAEPPGARFECDFGGGFGECESGVGFAMLAGGAHTVTIRGVDHFGNQGPDAVRNWMVDARGPLVTISSPMEDELVCPEGTVLYTADESPASFTCKLGGGDFAGCAADGLPFNLESGPVTVTVHATDAYGNQGPDAERSFVVDADGPVVKLTNPVNGATMCPDDSIRWNGDDAVSFNCALDESPQGCGGSTFPAANLGHGMHQFRIVGHDVCDNIGDPDIVFFSMDALGPSFTIVAPSGTTGPSGSITLSGEAPTSATCTIGGQSCGGSLQGGFSFSGLANGMHTLTVVGRDACGNDTTQSRTWTTSGG